MKQEKRERGSVVTMVIVFIKDSDVITLTTVEITVMKMDVVCHVHCVGTEARRCE